MSDPADDPSGEANGSDPQPSNWAQAKTASQPADEWVVSSDEDHGESAEASPAPDDASPGPAEATPEPEITAPAGRLIDVPAPLTASPRLPWDGSDVEQGVAPATDEPADTTAFVQVPDEPLAAEPEPEPAPPAAEPEPPAAKPEPPAADPVEAQLPGVNEPIEPEPAPTAFPEPITAPVQPETTPTAFETVTDSTFTSEPDPAVASATEASSPVTPGTVASITTEHPEYLIAAALIGGFLLAKVVKKLAH